MPDAVDIITKDHRKVEALFDKYQSGQTVLAEEICTELKVHTKIEEEVLYPALAEISGGESLKDHAEHEHQEVESAISRVEGAGYDSPEARRDMATIIEDVKAHVQEEESEVLPKMQSELGAERMTELGEQLLAAKRQQLVRLGALSDQSKDDLYRLAQTARIEGRSQMSKDQLINALQG